MDTTEQSKVIFAKLAPLLPNSSALGTGIDKDNNLIIYTESRNDSKIVETYLKAQYPDLKFKTKCIGKVSLQ